MDKLTLTNIVDQPDGFTADLQLGATTVATVTRLSDGVVYCMPGTADPIPADMLAMLNTKARAAGVSSLRAWVIQQRYRHIQMVVARAALASQLEDYTIVLVENGHTELHRFRPAMNASNYPAIAGQVRARFKDRTVTILNEMAIDDAAAAYMDYMEQPTTQAA